MAEKYDKVLVSYILGIISIVIAFFSPIVSVVLGIIGLFHTKKEKSSLKERAKVLNIIGIVLGILVFIVTLFVFTQGMLNGAQQLPA